MRTPRAALLLLVPALAGCPEGTGAFAPGGKAEALLKPGSGGAAPAAPGPAPAGAGDEALPAGHPQVGQGADASALLARVEAMKKEIASRPKTLEILVAFGNLYYENQRYLDAIDWYRQAGELGEPGWKRFLALPAAARGGRPSAAARAACARTASRQHAELSREAEALERRGALADAAFCWRQALRPALDARARRGNAFLLAGNPDQAAAEHEENLRREPGYADSLYFLGAILAADEGAPKDRLERARDAFGRYLAAAPQGDKAGAARDGIAQVEERIRTGGRKQPAPPMAARGGGAAAGGAAGGGGDAGGGSPGGGAGAGAPRVGAPGAVSEGAAEAIAALDTSDPGFWEAADRQVAQGEQLLAAGDPDQAKEYMKSLMPVMMMKGKDAPPALYVRVLAGMGWAYVQLGNKEMGPRLLAMALQRDPGNAQIRAGLDAVRSGQPLPPFRAPGGAPAAPRTARAGTDARPPPRGQPPAPAAAPAQAAPSPRALAAQGDLAYRRGEYARAASLWKQVLEADPYLAGELKLRGRIADAEKAAGR